MNTPDILLLPPDNAAASLSAWLPLGPKRSDLSLVVTPGPVVDGDWVLDALAGCEAGRVRAIVLTPGTPADPLHGVRRLVQSFLAELSEPIRQRYAVELQLLLPDHAAFAVGWSLDEIALPPSERRLSRESERLFRLVNGVAAMLNASLAPTPAERAGICLLVPELLGIDRLTLHVLHQLRRFQHPRIRLAAGISQADLTVIAALPRDTELTEPQAVRCRFAKDFLSLGTFIATPRPSRALATSPLNRHADRVDDAAATGLSQADIARLIEWGQYDQALAALRHLSLRDFAWHKACGLTHAYLGQYQAASDAYAQAGELAATLAQRAEVHVYRALLTSKRKGEHRAAQQIIEAGRRLLEGQDDEAALLELGWLSNVSALTHFFEGRGAEAMALCRSAYLSLKPFKGSEALHLKINLVSNLSVVYESMDRPGEALAVWENFAQFLAGSASALFAKIYHYRVAGLLWKVGDVARAEVSYQRSYEEAARVQDNFHLLYIAYDIGALHARQRAWPRAQAWFERSEQHARAVAEHDRAALAMAAQGLALRENGNTHGAASRWRAALADPLTPIAMHELLLGLLAGVADTSPGTLPEGLRERLIPAPGSKLGRPFHLVHIPPLPGLGGATSARTAR